MDKVSFLKGEFISCLVKNLLEEIFLRLPVKFSLSVFLQFYLSSASCLFYACSFEIVHVWFHSIVLEINMTLFPNFQGI